MAKIDIEPIAAWLLQDGRLLADAPHCVGELAKRIVGAGIPIARMNWHLPELHPEIISRTVEWTAEAVASENRDFRVSMARGIEYFQPNLRIIEIRRPREQRVSLTYHHSPIAFVYRSNESLRRRLVGPDAELDFPLLEELVAKGFTDYLLLPMRFGVGGDKPGAVGFAVRREEGFGDEHLAALSALRPAINAVAEAFYGRKSLLNVLDVYVGHTAGERIMQGQVTLGTGRTMRAAIWYSDLRGFTELSETMGRDNILNLLNAYFACQIPGIRENGGEILKFMGDGVLAVFRTDDESSEGACRAAFAAAEAASRELERYNGERVIAGSFPLNGGIALHYGDVTFGNIGAEDRLDFTVIGPAVNLAARIEGLCSALTRPLLMSEDFARLCGAETERLGQFALKGMAGERVVYGVRAA
ncbi:MAG: adenylate/guanylate cyclase domain-containing protein [Alphaproteobacteria bacterium]